MGGEKQQRSTITCFTIAALGIIVTIGMTVMDEIEPREEIDWDAGRELVGASVMQTRFARALVEGMNATAAARAAGYSGSGAALRGHAARVKKSNKVMALVQWARAGGAGPSDEPGDIGELERILWRDARAKDPTRRMKAVEILHRLETQKRERETVEPNSDPIETLNELAGLSPFLAQWLAKVHGITWNVPPIAIEKALAELEDVRKQIVVNAAKPNGAPRDVGREIGARPAP